MDATLNAALYSFTNTAYVRFKSLSYTQSPDFKPNIPIQRRSLAFISNITQLKVPLI